METAFIKVQGDKTVLNSLHALLKQLEKCLYYYDLQVLEIIQEEEPLDDDLYSNDSSKEEEESTLGLPENLKAQLSEFHSELQNSSSEEDLYQKDSSPLREDLSQGNLKLKPKKVLGIEEDLSQKDSSPLRGDLSQKDSSPLRGDLSQKDSSPLRGELYQGNLKLKPKNVLGLEQDLLSAWSKLKTYSSEDRDNRTNYVTNVVTRKVQGHTLIGVTMALPMEPPQLTSFLRFCIPKVGLSLEAITVFPSYHLCPPSSDSYSELGDKTEFILKFPN